jgi:hypothetical protein
LYKGHYSRQHWRQPVQRAGQCRNDLDVANMTEKTDIHICASGTELTCESYRVALRIHYMVIPTCQ